MAEPAHPSPAAAALTAVLVIKSDSESLLCPFFGKCDGVLLVKAVDGSSEFHPWDRTGARQVCELILKLKPRQLVCGFIGRAERKRLRAAGIDVRLGSCNRSVGELLASFSSLPKA